MHFQTFQRLHIHIFTLLPFPGIQSGDINSVERNHPHGVCIIKPPSAEIRSTKYACTRAKQGTKGFQKKGRKCVRLFKAVAAVMHEHKFCFNELWIFPLCLGRESEHISLDRPVRACMETVLSPCRLMEVPEILFALRLFLLCDFNVAMQCCHTESAWELAVSHIFVISWE